MASDSQCAHNYISLSQLKGTTKHTALSSLVLSFLRLQQLLE